MEIVKFAQLGADDSSIWSVSEEGGNLVLARTVEGKPVITATPMADAIAEAKLRGATADTTLGHAYLMGLLAGTPFGAGHILFDVPVEASMIVALKTGGIKKVGYLEITASEEDMEAEIGPRSITIPKKIDFRQMHIDQPLEFDKSTAEYYMLSAYPDAQWASYLKEMNRLGYTVGWDQKADSFYVLPADSIFTFIEHPERYQEPAKEVESLMKEEDGGHGGGSARPMTKERFNYLKSEQSTARPRIASQNYGFEVGQMMWGVIDAEGAFVVPVTIIKVPATSVEPFIAEDEDLHKFYLYGWDLFETEREAYDAIAAPSGELPKSASNTIIDVPDEVARLADQPQSKNPIKDDLPIPGKTAAKKTAGVSYKGYSIVRGEFEDGFVQASKDGDIDLTLYASTEEDVKTKIDEAIAAAQQSGKTAIVLKTAASREVVLHRLNDKGFYPDKFITNPNGVYTYKKSFYHKSGQTARMYADKLQEAFPGIEIVDAYDDWKEWPTESYFVVKLRFPDMPADPAESEEVPAVATAPSAFYDANKPAEFSDALAQHSIHATSVAGVKVRAPKGGDDHPEDFPFGHPRAQATVEVMGIDMSDLEYKAFVNYLNDFKIGDFTAEDVSKFLENYHKEKHASTKTARRTWDETLAEADTIEKLQYIIDKCPDATIVDQAKQRIVALEPAPVAQLKAAETPTFKFDDLVNINAGDYKEVKLDHSNSVSGVYVEGGGRAVVYDGDSGLVIEPTDSNGNILVELEDGTIIEAEAENLSPMSPVPEDGQTLGEAVPGTPGERKHRCRECHKLLPESQLIYGPDPFDSELSNDQTKVWQCPDCRPTSWTTFRSYLE